MQDVEWSGRVVKFIIASESAVIQAGNGALEQMKQEHRRGDAEQYRRKKMVKQNPIAGALLFGCSFALITTQAHAVEVLKTDKTTITLYGQVNKGFLRSDDGFQNESFPFVDNDNSSTRMGLKSKSDIGNGWTLGTKFEFQWEPYSSSNVSVQDKYDSDYEFRSNSVIRKIDLSFSNKTFGTFSLGQGSMASDGAADVDLSGTNVISKDPERVGGGLIFFDNMAGAYDLGRKVGDDFDNFDGGRRMRVRYDSPVFGGFKVSVAHGYTELLAPGVTDDRRYTDAALRYKSKFGSYKFEGAVFYAKRDSRPGRVEDRERVGGSAGLLHTPTGLNVRLSAGQEDSQSRTAKGDFFNVKAGIRKNLIKAGPTAFSVSYYKSDGLADEDARGKSWAVSAVQKIDKANLELYATYRNYSLNETGVQYNDIDVVLAGLRWKF